MAYRNCVQFARQALQSASKGAARSFEAISAGPTSAGRQLAQQSSGLAASSQMSAIRMFRQESMGKLGAGSFGSQGMAFAAGSLPFSVASPVSICGASAVQGRGAATAAGTDDADEEGTSTSTGTSSKSSTPSAGEQAGEDEDDPVKGSGDPLRGFDPLTDLLGDSRQNQQQQRDPRQRNTYQMQEYETMDSSDPLEHLIFAKESFMKKKEEVIPVPPSVREVMYRYHWDKLLVDVRRAVDITTKGKQESYTAMVAVGNLQGLFGLGLGVASTAQQAVARAYMDSYSKLTFVPLYRGHTIYHHVDHELHQLKMRLMPRRAGWGVKASGLITELCGLIGIKDISVKLVGRRKSKFYVAQCFQEALQQQSTPYDGVEGSSVYVREVFWSKKLPSGLQRGVDIM